jgi:outer membrane protein TolC
MSPSARGKSGCAWPQARAREAYRLEHLRYDAGAIDLLNVLDSQRTLLHAEDSRVQARQSVLNASAELALALGDSWHNQSGV